MNSRSSNTITLAQDASSSGVAGEWRLYGSYVFFYDSSKQLVSYFFAEPANNTGIFNLLWKLSEEQQAQNPNAVSVSLRTIAPVDARGASDEARQPSAHGRSRIQLLSSCLLSRDSTTCYVFNNWSLYCGFKFIVPISPWQSIKIVSIRHLQPCIHSVWKSFVWLPKKWKLLETRQTRPCCKLVPHG